LEHLNSAEQSIYWNSKAKFIFISPYASRKILMQISSFFYSFGILDTIIISYKGKDMKTYSYNPFETTVDGRFYRIENRSTIDDFYPDKLRNMKGYRYKVLFYNEYPMIFYKNRKGTLTGHAYKFLKNAAKHQNASIHLKYVKTSNLKHITDTFLESFNKGLVDLTLNTVKTVEDVENSIKQVNLFETDGFCILLPYPERRSFFKYFMEPFDLWTWIMIMATITSLVVVWHFLNKTTRHPNPNSAGYFLFSFIAFFIGQGAEFRDHRLIQKVLIQLMIMMTFILGNAYQSVLISMMSESRYGSPIMTIQETIDNNFSFYVDPTFMPMFNSSEQYQDLGEKIKGVTQRISLLNYQELSDAKTGLILTCSAIDFLYSNTKIKSQMKNQAIDFFYRMPERFYTFYKQFSTAPHSFHAERLQEYSLRIHESGVKEHWKTLLSFEGMEAVKARKSNANEEYLLNLKDMAGSFYCLIIGSMISLTVFLLEIIYAEFMKYLQSKVVKIEGRTRRMCGRVQLHRITQVKPRA
jgi:hypothetical protein